MKIWTSRKLYGKCHKHAHGNIDDQGDYNSSMHLVQSSLKKGIQYYTWPYKPKFYYIRVGIYFTDMFFLMDIKQMRCIKQSNV